MATNVLASTDRVQSTTGYDPEIVIESGHRWG
jgi:hypothetical protein